MTNIWTLISISNLEIYQFYNAHRNSLGTNSQTQNLPGLNSDLNYDLNLKARFLDNR